MITDYSKSLGDLAKEESERIKDEEKLFRRQQEANIRLSRAPNRKHCVLCGSEIEGSEFLHRMVPFIACDSCGHIQTRALPPEGFPEDLEGKEQFARIYPELDKDAFEDRKKRVYLPKLNWILSSLERSGYGKNELLEMRWMELGSGNGGFLSLLEDAGVSEFIGFEKEESLLERAKSVVPPQRVHLSTGSLGDVIRSNAAELICSFFVFEHDENLPSLISALRECRSGTLLCFSVPMFGLSCLLENLATERYARSLDAATHVQTFTERSIDYLLSSAGFGQIARWQFGQDALELRRLLLPMKGKKTHLAPLSQKIDTSLDEVQSAIDRAGLCDQIHIIARRENAG